MPSHIFTRLGLWQESIESNLVGHRAAKAYAEKTYGPAGFLVVAAAPPRASPAGARITRRSSARAV